MLFSVEHDRLTHNKPTLNCVSRETPLIEGSETQLISRLEETRLRVFTQSNTQGIGDDLHFLPTRG